MRWKRSLEGPRLLGEDRRCSEQLSRVAVTTRYPRLRYICAY